MKTEAYVPLVAAFTGGVVFTYVGLRIAAPYIKKNIEDAITQQLRIMQSRIAGANIVPTSAIESFSSEVANATLRGAYLQ